MNVVNMKLKHNFRKYLRVSLKLISIYLFGRQKFLKKFATLRAKTLWLKGKKFFTIFSFFSGLFCRVFLYSCLPHQPRLYLYTVNFSSAGRMHSMQSGWMRPTPCRARNACSNSSNKLFPKMQTRPRSTTYTLLLWLFWLVTPRNISPEPLT